jgi:hypothetical protein
MLLRQCEGGLPVYDVLGLYWREAGCGSLEPYQKTPAEAVARLAAVPADSERETGQAKGG